MRMLKVVALLASLALPVAGQQSDNTFNWTARIPAGQWIRIRNINGSITVGPASGDNVEVTATKHWRRGDPASVNFDTKKFGNESVLICALWNGRTSCDDDRNNRDERGNRNNDVSVEFRVLVPKGVKVNVNTVNGAVTVDGATSDVEASTVNGEVEASTTSGPINASSVNGGVRARLGKVDANDNMNMTTVNGSISVEFGGDFGADIDLETVMGSLNTNFPMTVSGRLNPKHLRAHIGKPGGPRIKLQTVMGSVELKKQ